MFAFTPSHLRKLVSVVHLNMTYPAIMDMPSEMDDLLVRTHKDILHIAEDYGPLPENYNCDRAKTRYSNPKEADYGMEEGEEWEAEKKEWFPEEIGGKEAEALWRKMTEDERTLRKLRDEAKDSEVSGVIEPLRVVETSLLTSCTASHIEISISHTLSKAEELLAVLCC